MRRLFLCWLALTAAVVAGLSLASRANMVQMPFAAGGGAYVGPLNVTTGVTALACYSVRACSTALATAGATALNLTRSTDSHTCNATLAATGGLAPNTAGCGNSGENNTALTTWCAGGASGTCSVVWVNQSGSWPHLTATGNAGNALAFSGCSSGALPCIVFVTDQSTYMTQLSAATPTDSAQPYSISAVFTATSAAGYCYVYSADNQQGALGLDDPAASTGSFDIATDTTNYVKTAGPLTTGSWYAIQGYYNGASSVLRSNGADTTGTITARSLTNGGAANSVHLSSYAPAGYPQGYAGRFAEFIVFANPGLSSALRTSLESNQRSYFGF
jgi:hypothetical protein